YRTTLTDRRKPNMATARIETARLTTKSTGLATGTTIPKSSQPHSRVAARLETPIVAIATVIGTRTRANDVGAATSSSSVPDHRSRCRALLAVVAIADQRPISA